uniref:VWFA domain-containing protein n=1 Tax=Romanomermis culicivorax TaxID=13658 RepID=A0A915IMU5_ROMCU
MSQRHRLCDSATFSYLFKLSVKRTVKTLVMQKIDQKIVVFGIMQDVAIVLQSGPKCGLVALKMAAQSFDIEISVEDIFRIAKESGITSNGEIFSAKWMGDLAYRSLNVHSVFLENDPDQPKRTLNSMMATLLDGDLILLPYDADKNNEPCCCRGHSAHWSIIIGFIAPHYDNLRDCPHFISDSFIDDLFWLTHDNHSYKYENICIENIYFIAAHGKSKHYNLWKGVDLLRSNSQLTELCPKRECDGLKYILPRNGVKELQNIMLILKKSKFKKLCSAKCMSRSSMTLLHRGAVSQSPVQTTIFASQSNISSTDDTIVATSNNTPNGASTLATAAASTVVPFIAATATLTASAASQHLAPAAPVAGPLIVPQSRKACTPTSVDIVVVIDASGSVEDVFNAYKRLTLEILDMINFDKKTANQMAVIQYSRFANVKYSFSSNQTNEDVYEAVDGLTFLGDTTRTADAVYLALEEFKKARENVPKIFVLMTDGNSFDAWDSTLAASGRLEKLNATKVIVALGTSVYEPEIKLYGKNGTIFKSGDSKDFKNFLATLTGNCPPPPRTTKPPVLPKIDCLQKSKIDLVIVIDSSGSVDSVFNAYKLLALELVKKLPFSDDGARLALIQYSRAPAFLKYKFTDQQNNVEIFKSVTALNFLGDTTNTADAVSLGHQQFGQARSDAEKIFVLMTDGNSFDPWNVVTQTAENLHKTKAKVYVVAFGDIIYQPEIKVYAKNGSIVRNSDARSFEKELFEAFCPKTGVVPPKIEISAVPAVTIGAPAPVAAPAPQSATHLTPDLALIATEKPILKLSTTEIPPRTFSLPPPNAVPLDIIQSAVVTQKATGAFSTLSPTEPQTTVTTLNSSIPNNDATSPPENTDTFLGDNTTSVSSSLISSGQSSSASLSTSPETSASSRTASNETSKITETTNESIATITNESPSLASIIGGSTTPAPPAELVPPLTEATLTFNITEVPPLTVTENVKIESLTLTATESTPTVEESTVSSTRATKKPILVPQGSSIARQKKSEDANSIVEATQESNAIEISQPADIITEPALVTACVKFIPSMKKCLLQRLPDIKFNAGSCIISLSFHRKTSNPEAGFHRPTYGTQNRKPFRTCAADIFFVLDSSGSVLRDFQKQISFMQGVLNRLIVDPTAHQVALLEYSGATRQRLQFSFNVYTDKESLQNAINGLPFFSGTTSTGEALIVAKRALADRRRGVPLYVIVITDGFSQDDATSASLSLRNEPNSQLFVVGVSDPLEKDELTKIAGDEKHVFISIDPSDAASRVSQKIPSCSGFRIIP